jgi:catechol 2,3-dioxygenase-like lactoylglutathione lyase family enzyme
MFLEHVNVTVSDIDHSIDLYGKLLDLRVRWEGKTKHGRKAAHVGDDRCYIALFHAREPGKPDNNYYRPGLNHFGFVVSDLDAAKRRLAEFGLTPHAEEEYDPGRRLYFFDPDGIEVELVQYDN